MAQGDVAGEGVSCPPCCDECCLSGREAICFTVTGGNGLTAPVAGTNAIQLPRHSSSNQLVANVNLVGSYVDPTSGLSVCYGYAFSLAVVCTAADELQWMATLPDSPIFDVVDGSCRLVTSYPGTTTDTTVSGTLDGSDCDNLPSFDVSIALPGNAAAGIPAQTFNLTFAFNLDCDYDNPASFDPVGDSVGTLSNTYLDMGGNCCTAFDGGDIPGPGTTPGGAPIPAGRIWTPCCDPFTIAQLLSIAMTAGGACTGCFELLGGLVYVRALGAWAGNFIACGGFLTVYFYCAPGAGNIFGIDIRYNGLQIGTPAPFTLISCNPLSVICTSVMPDGPWCPGGGTVTIQIFE